LSKPLFTRFELEKAVVASINVGLAEVVGEKCRTSIIRLFLKDNGLRSLDEVVDHPEKFEKFLDKVFGKGSVLVLDRIMYNLRQRTFPIEYSCFSEQVSRLRELCLV
jgi:hypothetical protein